MADGLEYQNRTAALRECKGLRGIFGGPTDRQLLHLLAAEVGGDVIPAGLFQFDCVRINFGGWTLNFDYVIPSRSTATRVRCRFVTHDNFTFRSTRASPFTRFARLLGVQDRRLGIPLIDESLVLHGTDPFKVRALFADPHVIACLCAQPPGWVHFGVERCRPVQSGQPETFELNVTLNTRVKHSGHLRQLLQFSAAILDRLVAIGSAGRYIPDESA